MRRARSRQFRCCVAPLVLCCVAPLVLCLVAALALGACSVGPPYQKPLVEPPAAYKEWKAAEPGDDTLRGAWWQVFGDPQLSALEEQVSASNQNVATAMSNFLAARALVKQARTQYLPKITTAPSITALRAPFATGSTGSSTATSGSSAAPSATTAVASGTVTEFALPFDASWTPDLWGRVRNTVLVNVSGAQATAADLENIRLTMQAELAVDFYELRAQDALQELFDATVRAYRDSLEITQAQLRAGITSDETVAQAETQLEATEAQDINLGILRAQNEHAIALLVGQPASVFSVPAAVVPLTPPTIPVGVPSALLERRPDIAAAERRMVQANAQIGVASAAFFPTVMLSASGGFEATSIASWLAWPSRFWSVGPALAQTLFDAGLRRATVQQYQATFMATVATYRQTVLTAFEQVENNLAALRILSREIEHQDAAVASADRSLRLATARYRAGIDPYLNVITAQTTLLANQQAAVNLRAQQMTTSVQLIEALGGGWDASQLPSPADLAEPVQATSSASASQN
jgi:NodT family efflux transporter outer membrane factor (OMF) lipoprotein